jgi:hypothetical protein
MSNAAFKSAADRIAYSEAVDFVEQGRIHLIAPELITLYIDKGLWTRDGDRLRLTDEGLRQHEIAVRERFSDG